MAFATAFLVGFTVFVLAVPVAMVAVLVYAAPGRVRGATRLARPRARTAEHVVAVQEAAA